MEGLTHPARRQDRPGLLKALIEEAWQRARRRRRTYAGVALFMAIVGSIGLATLQGPARSQGGSPVVLGGAGAQAPRFAALQPAAHGVFRLGGRHGTLVLAVKVAGEREWDVVRGPQMNPSGSPNTGRYAPTRGGGGHVEAGGHASSWYARLVGYITAKPGARKQHVVIKLKGRPDGTFVITPTQPGVLTRDSGTQSSAWLG